MYSSLKRFTHFFSESRKDFELNLKIYSLYIVFFMLTSIVQITADSYIPEKEWWARGFSKFLFSGIPILVLSKILYIVKVRMDGQAEYSDVLIKNMLYSGYYFCLVMICSLLYPLSVLLLSESGHFNLQTSFIVSLPFLAPFFYVIMFFSLSPFVAVFEEKSFLETFIKSRDLTKKDITLVFINHISSLVIPSFFGLMIYTAEVRWRIGLGVLLSIPEAVLTIIFLLTSIKVYIYLSSAD